MFSMRLTELVTFYQTMIKKEHFRHSEAQQQKRARYSQRSARSLGRSVEKGRASLEVMPRQEHGGP